MKNRIEYIDFLKFIGLLGIIIAHVESPNWLMMIRSFDVPLMVIISSLLASYSIKKYNFDCKSIISYYISRFKRLVFPTWIFLIIYFIFRFVFMNELMNISYYLDTFLLTRYGFGYVWIILIYLYCALLIPIFRFMGFNKKSIMIVLVVYLLYEILYYFGIGTTSKLIDTTLFYVIPYGLLTFIGFNYEKISNKKRIVLMIFSFFIFTVLVYYYYVNTGSFQLVSVVKYPPRAYYLSYGLLCSILLMIIFNKINLKIFKNKVIVFISKHSMWIYLWHILVLDIYQCLHLPELWYVKLLIVYIGACIIVYIINKILDIIERKHKYKFFEYLR